MEFHKKTVWTVAAAAFAVLAGYWGLQNLTLLGGALRAMVSLIAPFLLGCAVAFILNVPMRAVERRMGTDRRTAKLRRPVAFVITLGLVLGVLALASLVIVPSLGDAVSSVSQQAQTFFTRLPDMLSTLETRLPELETALQTLDIQWTTLSAKALELLRDLGEQLVNTGVGGVLGGMSFVGSVVSGVSTFFIGLVFAVYLLLQKEKLGHQIRQILYALLPERAADRILSVADLANRTFSNFLSGQCLEAVILGSLFIVTMPIFKMPYAVLVGVTVSLTALIPIVGAFIGCAVGALLILLVNPVQALLFIVLFLVIQQIEGNLIYPHVVGSSVGLPSIWVLVAVILGGKLMGILGMLVFIPLCSVLYALFRQFVKDQLAERKISPSKLRPHPPQGSPPSPPVKKHPPKHTKGKGPVA
ncbi:MULTISPECIES: AI-2E family transporter [unclassified Oscillibacter]|uniref:AI-2E family transporter n=1 Tax=unclassified Oscillibacter TaxID=2629304 RepID=UPI0025CC2138|nr:MULTISPECIES: AI-2E family transporter [unclassified Oscillibacter]